MMTVRLLTLLLLLGSAAPASHDAMNSQNPVWTSLDAGRAELVLTLPDGAHTAVLRPARVRAPDFRVRVQGADGEIVSIPPPPACVWTGQFLDRPDSRLVVRRHGDRLHGLVTLAEDSAARWLLQAAAGTGSLTYRESSGGLAGACGVTETPAHVALSPPAADKDAAAPVLFCELACDADMEFFVANNGSVSETVADIETVIAGVSQIYSLDVGIAYQITDILVRTAEPDPYTTSQPYALLDQFSVEWRNNQGAVTRDLAHLFTGKDLDGTPVGIAWQADALCNTYNGYSLVQSRFSDDLGERIAISAHEIGHTYDAVHCDYGPSWWCRIMCANIGGCSGGYHSLGPLSIETIVEARDGATCLSPGEVILPTTSLPFEDDFPSSGTPDPTKWMAGDLVKVISRRLELESGDTWGVNELGTIRTLPMQLDGAARLSFRWRSSGLPYGQPLRIEYFDSDTWSWILLHTLLATGETSGPWSDFSVDIPAAAAGAFFAVRLSADGNGGDSSDEWHIDDVLMEPLTVSVPHETPAADSFAVSVAPNPFNALTEVVLTLPRRATVRVVVRDGSGRSLALLQEGDLGIGTHRLRWDGRDAHGRSMASGTYLMDFLVGDERRSIKTVLLK